MPRRSSNPHFCSVQVPKLLFCHVFVLNLKLAVPNSRLERILLAVKDLLFGVRIQRFPVVDVHFGTSQSSWTYLETGRPQPELRKEAPSKFIQQFQSRKDSGLTFSKHIRRRAHDETQASRWQRIVTMAADSKLLCQLGHSVLPTL